MNPPQVNYPAHAETRFRELCDLRDVTRNKAEQDRTGWDYLVEFERSRLSHVAHDKQVGTTTARVQVKSARDGKRRTSLKLSNAIRFTNEPDICFIVLFSYDSTSAGHRIFARHFDGSLMAPTLKRAREADHHGQTDLHKLHLPVSFTNDDDHTDDLIAWMGGICDQAPEIYAADKRRKADELGYEHIIAKGSVSFRLEHMQAFVDASVGLADPIPVEHAIVEDIRFGIAARAPLIEGPNVRVLISVNPKLATLVVEGANGARAEFEGKFQISLPGMPVEMARAVFRADGVTAVLASGTGSELNYEIIANRPYPLSVLHAICQLQYALRSATTMTFQVAGGVPLPVEWPAQETQHDAWFDETRMFVDALMKALPHSTNPELSIQDLWAAQQRLHGFAAMLSEAEMMVSSTIMVLEGEMPLVRNFVGFAAVDVAGRTYWAICRRPCISQEIDTDVMTLTFGGAIVLECGISDQGCGIPTAQLVTKNKAMSDRLGHGTVILNDGDPTAAASDLCIMIS